MSHPAIKSLLKKSICIVFFLSHLVHIFPAYAKSGANNPIYRAEQKFGFVFVQTEEKIHLYYNKKLLRTESNDIGIECQDRAYSELVGISPVTEAEKLLIQDLKKLSPDEQNTYSVYYGKMKVKHPKAFNTLVKRYCWKEFFSLSKSLGKNWYVLYFPQYDMSREYYFNKRTEKFIFSDNFYNLGKYEIGKSGLYIHNEYGFFDASTIYLLKDDGTYRLQYQEKMRQKLPEDIYLQSFELMTGRKIKLLLGNNDGIKTEKIISVK